VSLSPNDCEKNLRGGADGGLEAGGGADSEGHLLVVVVW
jgi:hypothetical protein